MGRAFVRVSSFSVGECPSREYVFGSGAGVRFRSEIFPHVGTWVELLCVSSFSVGDCPSREYVFGDSPSRESVFGRGFSLT